MRRLGLRSSAAFVAFFSQPAHVHPGMGPDGAIAAERINDEESDEMDREKSIAPPPVEGERHGCWINAPAAPERVNPPFDALEAVEGTDADTLIAEALAPASAHMTPHTLRRCFPGLSGRSWTLRRVALVSLSKPL